MIGGCFVDRCIFKYTTAFFNLPCLQSVASRERGAKRGGGQTANGPTANETGIEGHTRGDWWGVKIKTLTAELHNLNYIPS